jgi:hypothetical protein
VSTFVALQHNRTSLLTEDSLPEENGHGAMVKFPSFSWCLLEDKFGAWTAALQPRSLTPTELRLFA